MSVAAQQIRKTFGSFTALDGVNLNVERGKLVALLGPVEAFRQAQIDVASTFNYTPYVLTALIFILLTIPLARLTDWLIARDRRRQLALGVR